MFEVHLPAFLLQFGLNRQDVEQRIIEWLVLSLFTEERISSGKAARLLGITRVEFLALLKSRGIAFINHMADELAEEFVAVEALTVDFDQTNSNQTETQ